MASAIRPGSLCSTAVLALVAVEVPSRTSARVTRQYTCQPALYIDCGGPYTTADLIARTSHSALPCTSAPSFHQADVIFLSALILSYAAFYAGFYAGFYAPARRLHTCPRGSLPSVPDTTHGTPSSIYLPAPVTTSFCIHAASTPTKHAGTAAPAARRKPPST